MYSWKFLRAARLACAVAIGVGATALVLDAQGARAREWLTWGGDQERTGWNRNETAISKQNVRRLALRWKSQIDKEVSIEIESGNSMLTAPLVAQNVRTPGGPKTVLYTLSAANTLAALDAATGKPIWQRTIDRTVEPRSAANWICTNMSTATPVIDKAAWTIYMISADGRLHGLDISTGEAKLVPPPEFVTPYSRNWSLNLVDGVLYTSVGRGCGNGPVPGAPAPPPGTLRGGGAATICSQPAASEAAPARAGGAPAGDGASPRAGGPAPAAGQGGEGRGRGRGAPPPPVAAHMIAMDTKNPSRRGTKFFTSTARPNGAWSRAGLGMGPRLVDCADGGWSPGSLRRVCGGQTLLRLAPRTLNVVDYFTPPNLQELNANDLDYGSGGTLGFTFQNRPLVVSGGKDGTIYLLDAKSLLAVPIIGPPSSR